jgi:hypothetical protein
LPVLLILTEAAWQDLGFEEEKNQNFEKKGLMVRGLS